MNVGALKNIVLQDTDDNVDGGVLLSWLERGYEYLQQSIIIPDLETSVAVSFTAGLGPLPSDFIHFVELKIGSAFYRNQIDYENRNDSPSDYAFYLWGTQIGVVPAITASGTLAYVQQAPVLTLDTDVPKLPAIFHTSIAEYAKGLYREQNSQFAKATAHFNNVDNAIERLSAKLSKRVRRKSTAWGDVRSRFPS